VTGVTRGQEELQFTQADLAAGGKNRAPSIPWKRDVHHVRRAKRRLPLRCKKEDDMSSFRRASGFIWGVAVLLAVGVLLSSVRPQETQPKPQENKSPERLIFSVRGADLFRAYCASCHGADGKGNGPVAPALNSKPSDLTAIAQRNGGVFPAQRMRTIIAGDAVILAHGSREMPIWGPIFHQVEWDQDLGEVRLQNLIKYLQSIQQR
jgi:mono/diheme cytochrome c family protein